MAKKITGFKTKGMNRDLSVSAFNPEFAFENRNLRLMTNDNNTMLSWVNEKGTAAVSLVATSSGQPTSIQGKPIGTAVLNHKLILFTTDGPQDDRPDYIYMLENNSGQNVMGVTQLYNGNLKFDITKPIETTVSYESDSIQKVYWTDNENQPRLINIAKRYNTTDDDTQFDFVCTLKLEEEVSIEKKIGVSGMFAPGVIQYALTYYHRYGQESNIFYTSPLQYISYIDRGASPEDKVDNAFTITIKNVDTNFDYLRIYSIQRTSVNATPICKRVHDFEISKLTASKETSYTATYTDTGIGGDSIDPMELLYKGGDSIKVMTMEQKDNTLFMGNFSIIRQDLSVLKDFISEDCTVESGKRTILISAGNASRSGNEYYKYGNQLTATAYSGGTVEPVGHFNSQDGLKSVPCSGFKYGDYYRCGLQFQYKTGKWSDPVFINNKNDVEVTTRPAVSELGLGRDNLYCVDLPALVTEIPGKWTTKLIEAGYLRARAVVVFPNIQDRVTLCQGVICPTLYTEKHRNDDKDIYAQSSWFFRPPVTTGLVNNENGTAKPTGGSKDEGWNPYLTYTDNQVLPGYPRTGDTPYNPADIRAVEVQGYYDSENRFKIDRTFVTMHSPDVEFDTQLYSVNYDNTKWAKVGYANFVNTLSDIDIQTETPAASGDAAGFVHKSFADTLSYGIVAGLFYEDYIVDDNVQGEDEGITDKIEPWWEQKSPVKWMVYPWNKSGSLNNDFNRPADAGIPSAILKKKVISNLRIARSSWIDGTIRPQNFNTGYNPKLFSSNEATILRFGNNNYQGNVDTILSPDEGEGQYFAFNGINEVFDNFKRTNIKTQFTDPIRYKTFGVNFEDLDVNYGLWKYSEGAWYCVTGDKLFGDRYLDVCVKRGDVRMKYKSSPHLVFLAGSIGWRYDDELPIVEVRNPDTDTRFGGKSNDALKENIWVPCGEPVLLEKGKDATVWFSYGDTYYQRYDCLKTYPFTFEDPNQIVEIGSFMLETHVNIDGRYDRNRGQLSNINMSPQNFNLINPVYSQIDNFFTYRYHDDDYYKDRQYINQITWSKTKSSGADIDAYTNVTLASTLELDGDKGAINKLIKFNNDLLAFQDTGLSQILYNVNTVISTTQGVPVEIGNSDKVQGKNYISGTVGCTNKWSVVSTPSGIYFMDSHDKNIYMFNGKIENLSLQKGMNSWVKQNMPNLNNVWTPQGFESFVSYYDKLNQEVYFINDSTALTYSEKLGVFTSFYDYGNTPYFCNFESMGLWIRNPYKINNVEYPASIWRHNAGNYCSFFGTQHPFSMTLVGNPEPQMDKIFTNLEFRANVDGEGTVSGDDFTPYLPFNSLETWNEYQHGITTLNIRNGHDAFKHHDGSVSSLKRKFRIWRCDIPRDNAALALDEGLNIKRFSTHPIDRMRNPWIYLKLQKSTAGSNLRTEVHDILMTYFD